MMTRILNNDYLLSRVMSFLGVVLTLLGFTSCGDDEEKPMEVWVAYGSPSPTTEILCKVTGCVLRDEGILTPGVCVKVEPVGKDFDYVIVKSDTTKSDGMFRVWTEVSLKGERDVREHISQLRVIASDTSGVYENDTVYLDYHLTEMENHVFYATSSSAVIDLLKKKTTINTL